MMATVAADALGSTTQVKRSPCRRATIATATPKLPELDSTRCAPGGSDPSARPPVTMLRAERSFMLPPGFISSSFASTSTPGSSNIRRSDTSGVRPTQSSTESCTRSVATPPPCRISSRATTRASLIDRGRVTLEPGWGVLG